jgi:hypothetical protein
MMMQHLKTLSEITTEAEERYPYPAKCCRLKRMAIDEKRKLYIQRINESQSNHNPAKAR